MKPIADSLKVGGVKGLKAYIFPKKKQKKFNIVKRERKREKVFKNEPSKIYGRQRLTHLKGMVCVSRPYPFKFLKGCIPQILLNPFFVPNEGLRVNI